MEDVKLLKEELTPEGVILEAQFAGGCPGNTVGVATLIRGMKTEDAIARLEGIRCGGKPTSCPDQMSRALRLL